MRIATRIAWAAGLAALVASCGYTVASLVRWEWNRAQFFALLVVATEVGLATALLLLRLRTLERRLDALDRPPSPALRAVRRARDDHRRFAWLRSEPDAVLERTNVFVTMIVGGGALLSVGAWIVDKVASHTTDPRREVDLAGRLDSIAYRPGLLVDDEIAAARERPERAEADLSTFLGRERR